MVIVNLDNTVRAEWPLARIKQLITSHDGQCRAAEVLLPNGRCLTRPINLLIPLEVHSASPECREERESLDTLGPEAATTTTHTTCFTGTMDTATATVHRRRLLVRRRYFHQPHKRHTPQAPR
uniref:DUF5641 domain-containing protein n=1 Tax=Panagrellus redivivus TaxID=6233 RepID=A0A7E4V1S0_PANRE